MSYDYVNYRRRQYDLPQPAQPFHPYQPVQPRLATCWNPPGSHDPPGIPPYDQPPPRYRSEPYGPPQPHRMGSVQTRRPSCWEPPPCRASRGDSDYDQPVQQIDRCRPPPYNGPYMEPDSDLQPRQSYARYRSWQPQYQPRSATKAEDPINAKLDRLLEACDKIETWFDATNRRFSKFRSSPQPEPDLDQPNASAPLRKMAYPPSRNNEASFGPSGLVPNESADPPRHRTKSDQPPARQPSCWEPPLMATPAVDQIHQPYPPLPRSDRPPQQPSPALPLELLPYSTPGPFQLSHPLPLTTPFVASTLRPEAAIRSSMKKECERNIQEGEERMEIENIIVEYKAAIETTKPDLKVKMDVRRSLFEDEPRLKSKELGKKGDVSYTGLPIIACVYMDLNVRDVTSMNHRPTSLDTDARLIPPRNETSCLGILRGVEKLFVLVWNFADHIGSPLLIFDGVEEGRHSIVRCVFDPGGDVSPRLLLSTLYVASWFPP